MPLPICLAPTGSSLHRNAAASYWESIIALQCYQNCYHRLTRANTPASAPLRRFLSFSPWRAPARLRLKSQKSLGNPSQAGAKQFCRAEMCPDKGRPAGNTCRISKGLDAVWAYFCPSKPCLPLSTDGIVTLALLIAAVKKEIAQYFPDIESIFKRVSINRGKEPLQPATTGYPSGASRRGSGDCRKSLWVFSDKRFAVCRRQSLRDFLTGGQLLFFV